MKFKLRRYYLYYAGRVLAFILYLVPLRIGFGIGSLLGGLAFHIAIRYRHIAIENLKIAFGDTKTECEIEKIAKRAFQNLGKNAVELVNFPKINESNINSFVTIKNIERLNSALAKGMGVLIVTGHFGNWELLASTVTLNRYSGVVIGRRIYFDQYNRFLNHFRKMHNVNIVYRDESPKKVLRVLRNNEIVGILADQDVDSVDGVFVNFFGRPAYTPTGPVALARASNASLVPAFIVREGSRHQLVIEEPIELIDTCDKEKDLVANTQRWSDVLESYIRRYPEQWVWMHRRWKTKKAGS